MSIEVTLQKLFADLVDSEIQQELAVECAGRIYRRLSEEKRAYLDDFSSRYDSGLESDEAMNSALDSELQKEFEAEADWLAGRIEEIKKSRNINMKWNVYYDNDTGPNDEGFLEWWTVTDGDRSFKAGTKKDAEWLCHSLNERFKE